MRIFDLIVGPGREEHIARHGVRLTEVEEVVFGDAVNFRARHGYYGGVGQTAAGRHLTVILAPLQGSAYSLVTARDADQAERRLYWRRRRL